ncbi:hypothetical protein HOD38_00150 [archaeon]|mgnify:CR=1|jgi:hypothetical protein|nr:hypothetical protein [archaeon]MBT4396657.1 hypothetical protein [archaeon]MBT4441267.1 hypothetical protein [archaeon]
MTFINKLMTFWSKVSSLIILGGWIYAIYSFITEDIIPFNEPIFTIIYYGLLVL